MSNESGSDESECCEDTEFDRRIGAVAKDIYETSEMVLSGEPSTFDAEVDVCPLYNSILQINNRYQAPSLVGRGGMKEVYRVYDIKTSRHVALAKPLEKHSTDHFDAFLREAHLTARLQHPGIIDLFDMGIDEQERPFFTMEFKRGRSLREFIRQVREPASAKKYPLRRRLEVFERICEAIAYAHSRRVLHLDIKPSNIQIGEFGEVQVCDWGLGVVMQNAESEDNSAALLDPDLYGPLLTQTIGTPNYMAPEQRDQRLAKSPQMDIYSLGCVLHEIISGKKYQGEQQTKKFDTRLSAIVGKAVSDAPANRYASVSDLHNDLSRYMSHHSTSVDRLSVFREAVLFWKRHREACLVVLGAFVLLATFLSYFVFQLAEKEQVAVDARRKAEAAETEAVNLSEKYRDEVNAAERLLFKLRVSNTRMETFRRQEHDLFSGPGGQSDVHQSIKLYSQLIQEKPPRGSRAWEFLFWWSLIAQDFEAAVQLIDRGDSIPEDLVQVGQRFAPLLNEEGYLGTEDLIDLLQRLSHRSLLCSRILAYDRPHPRSAEDRSLIICSWVDLNNGNAGETQLDYDADSRRLRIRGPVKRLKKFIKIEGTRGCNLNFLQTLDPLYLDLRKTKVKNVSELIGLKLVEVDLRQTPVSNLSPLKQFRSLQRIIVEEGQFPMKQLEKVPEWTEVIAHPPSPQAEF